MLSQAETAFHRLPPALSVRLDAVLGEQRAAMAEDLRSLAARLEPLIGAVDAAESINFERASTLDTAVTWLIFGSVVEAGSLEQQTARLRTALSR
jgi:hypothetical protein